MSDLPQILKEEKFEFTKWVTRKTIPVKVYVFKDNSDSFTNSSRVKTVDKETQKSGVRDGIQLIFLFLNRITICIQNTRSGPSHMEGKQV